MTIWHPRASPCSREPKNHRHTVGLRLVAQDTTATQNSVRLSDSTRRLWACSALDIKTRLGRIVSRTVVTATMIGRARAAAARAITRQDNTAIIIIRWWTSLRFWLIVAHMVIHNSKICLGLRIRQCLGKWAIARGMMRNHLTLRKLIQRVRIRYRLATAR